MNRDMHPAFKIFFDHSIRIMFSSRPGSYALQQGWVRFVLAALVISPLLESIKNTNHVIHQNDFVGRHFRLTLRSTIDTAQDHGQSGCGNVNTAFLTSMINPEKLQVSNHGVTLHANISVPTSGDEFILSFDDIKTIDRVSLQLVSQESTHRNIVLKIEVSDDGETWHLRHLPSWLVTSTEQISTQRPGSDVNPKCKTTIFGWHLRAGWQWILDRCFRHMFLCGACLASCCFGLANEGRKGVKCMALAFLINALVFLVILISRLAPAAAFHLSDDGPFWIYFQRFLVSCVLSASLALEGYHLLDVTCFSLAYVCAALVAVRVNDYLTNQAELPALALASPLSNLAVHVCVAAALRFGRRAVRRWVEDLVQRDRDAYDARWDKLRSLPSEASALQSLDSVARGAVAACAARAPDRTLQPPRQRCAPRPPTITTPGSPSGSPPRALPPAPTLADSDGRAAAEPSGDAAKARALAPPPVECLHHLYRQAGQAEALLRVKCMELALAAGGCFWVVSEPTPSPSGGGFFVETGARAVEAWASARARVARGGARVEWAGPKPAGRAREKMMLCYQGDPSRLLDCCRCGPRAHPSSQGGVPAMAWGGGQSPVAWGWPEASRSLG